MEYCEKDQDASHAPTGDYIQIPLKGVVSIAEMRNPVSNADDYDPTMLVENIGQKTALTFGFASTCKSVIRILVDGIEVKSDVWPVITKPGVAFSTVGDSGSCVWDMNCRVAGMIVAGNGAVYHDGFIVDATYFKPMEAELKDMERMGFKASLNFFVFCNFSYNPLFLLLPLSFIILSIFVQSLSFNKCR